MKYKYTIIIQWSDEDQCFVVSLPDFKNVMQPCTHGDTYEEALQNAKEVLELLFESALEDGESLPEPEVYSFQGKETRHSFKMRLKSELYCDTEAHLTVGTVKENDESEYTTT
jgi:predicted RNase H-like HicB family nuclease